MVSAAVPPPLPVDARLGRGVKRKRRTRGREWIPTLDGDVPDTRPEQGDTEPGMIRKMTLSGRFPETDDLFWRRGGPSARTGVVVQRCGGH